MSIDPDVAETGQPYAFTGDDPLNATDPLGLIITRPGGNGGGNSAAPVVPKQVVTVVATTHGSIPITVHTGEVTIPTPSPITIKVVASATVSGPDPIAVGVEQDGTVDLTDAGLISGSISLEGAVSAAGHDLAYSPGDGIGFSPSTTFTIGSDTVVVTITASFKLNRFPGGDGSLGVAAAGTGGLIGAASSAAESLCGNGDDSEVCVAFVSTALGAVAG